LTGKETPCRNYGRELTKEVDKEGDAIITYGFTCHSHAKYFEDEEKHLREWFAINLKVPPRNRKVYTLYKLEFNTKTRLYIERCLEHKLIVPKKENFQVFKELRGSQYAMFILLCAKYVDKFSLCWIADKKFCEEVFLTLWNWSISIGPVYVQKYDILRICCKDMSIEEFDIASKACYTIMKHLQGDNWNEIYKHIVCIGFDISKDWALQYCMGRDEKDTADTHGVSESTVRGLSKWWLGEWKIKQGKKIEALREELLQQVLSPGFVLDSVLSWDDAMDLRLRWS
jgi:hypothetical protein